MRVERIPVFALARNDYDEAVAGHSPEFRDRPARLQQVLEQMCADDGVKFGVIERQRFRLGDDTLNRIGALNSVYCQVDARERE